MRFQIGLNSLRVSYKGVFASQIFRNIKALPKYVTDRKLKMSVVFIFEIRDAKKDKIFNFLKGSFSIMQGSMDMIFGVFSETYVRLPTSITFQFFSRYSKGCNNLNVKSCLKLNGSYLTKRQAVLGSLNYMQLIQLYKFSLEWSW